MKVGQFDIVVYEPYPAWVLLRYGEDGSTLQFSHKEISDLEYAIQWAKREAREKLGPSRAGEVL